MACFLLAVVNTFVGLYVQARLRPACAWAQVQSERSWRGCRLRAANKTLLASLPRLVVLPVLPATQCLARTATLSFVSRSKRGGAGGSAVTSSAQPSEGVRLVDGASLNLQNGWRLRVTESCVALEQVQGESINGVLAASS